MTLANYPQLIGLIGASGAGKSTVARMLAEDHGYAVLPMSCVLKDMLRVLGFTEADLSGSQRHRATPQDRLGGMSPREVAQKLGTEWARNMVHPDLLVNAVRERIVARLATGCKLVIDGMRFPNEGAMIHALGGRVWSVDNGEAPRRTVFDKLAHMLGWHPRIHESEYHWRDIPADFALCNTSTHYHLWLELTDALLAPPLHVHTK